MEKVYYPNLSRKIIIRRFSSDGIYQVKRKSTYPLIEHYGIIVVGKHLEELEFYDKRPRVIHKTDSGIHADFFNPNEWQSLKFIPANKVNQEIVRIKMSLRSPSYYLVSGNCENFSRFVMEGISYSTQVQNGVVMGGLVLALILSRYS
ncbi:MAG: hypothetical protein M3T96_07955 [Acidobacteriota bacterium]|nr:hypothetical protein [Acidobacteriota bacterium]